MNSAARSFLAVCCLTYSLVHAATSLGDERLPSALQEVINAPRFKHAHWGILVVDLATGEVRIEHDADKLFAPASTTKLYSVATALDALGADYRFETPIFRRGAVDADGQLHGDLILVASGDLSLGGRTDGKGEIAFTNNDHTYANGGGSTDLTKPDPLAGLDDLARQIASAGIKQVSGDVLIDDRLFEKANSTGSGPTRVTPIMVNDNVIDVTVSPAAVGSPASIDWRPRSSTLAVENKVETVTAGGATKIEFEGDGKTLTVRGTIPAEHKPIVRVHEIENPAVWARTLLIEALERAKVDVAADADREPTTKLPETEGYGELVKVALLRSPPFAESARLILKVSHNLHASTLPLLVAAKNGKRSLADGLHLQHEFFERADIGVDTISFGGAAGGANSDFTTPRANASLLRYMFTRPDFADYERGLPILGVDGTLAEAVDAKSPARGKVQAKTGTLYWQNVMNDRYLLTSKALAGYMTAKSGRRLVISFVVNGVHIEGVEQRNEIGKTLGRLCEIVYEIE